MKSYKDLDKDIILNAPEGAMWWHTTGQFYYRLNNGKIEYIALEDEYGWQLSYDYSHDLSAIQKDNPYIIPLPNVEIPWEATEDSKCPVPDGLRVKVFFDDNEYDTDSNPEGWGWTHSNKRRNIVAYKIIDEEYIRDEDSLPSAQEDDIVSYKLPLYTNAEPLPCGNPLVELTTWATKEEVQQKALIKRLEFLQNLANRFPEIQNEVIKFMECELDGYMNTLWEKDNDNG